MNENKEIIVKNNQYTLNLNNIENLIDELVGLDGGFEKIKIPSGGNLNFEIPSLTTDEDDQIFVKEFSAVILHHHPFFAYYEDKYNGSNTPPNCFSFDGMIGTGTPGGKCKECTFNMFGSGENGSKACKNKHKLYLLRENEIFPLILVLPASSIQEFSKYIRRLLCVGKKSESVVTKLTLKKAVNKTGISFSKVHFSVSRDLSEQEKENLQKLISQIKNTAQSQEILEV